MSSSPSDPTAYDPAAGEKLIIETPEQTSIEFPLAGIGSRFLAVLIDTLIQGAVLILLGLIFMGLGLGFRSAGFAGSQTAGVWIVAILIFLYFLLMYGYFILFESIWNGQTPGKRSTHLRVIKDSGQPITAIDAVGRNLLRIVDQLPFAYGIGVLCSWISPQSKRLGDYVAGTVVVHEKPFEIVAPLWNAPVQAATHQYGANRLTPEEIALVETFLSRRNALDAGVRYDAAAGIVRRIESKLTMPPERPSAEKLLEELSHERRATAGYR
ncbi:MAG TPA: RDD family protein [Candidatus Acidoferrum sp.]|nr:RDD family protein [Candidatus Acidoferrum sp.]